VNGKDKCKILKEIRREIASKNDINLVTEECTHQGACKGTCPRCEAEVAYLERELEKRRQIGRRVALAGISAGMTLTLASCQAIEPLAQVADTLFRTKQTPVVEDLTGAAPMIDPGEIEVLEGEVADPELVTMGIVLMEDHGK
jgi:hypothetical protein